MLNPFTNKNRSKKKKKKIKLLNDIISEKGDGENKRGGISDSWLDVRKRGGGVIQMRTVCNRGGGRGLKIRKKCICN